jgi:hypothetical protein
LVLQLSCPNSLLMKLSKKNFKNVGCSCFFLAQAQFQNPAAGRAAARTPSSSCVAVALSRLSTAPMMAPTPSCGRGPAPSPSRSGRGTRSSPSAASRLARKRTPHLAVRDVTADCRASAQAVLPPPSGSRLQSSLFLHLLLRCRHEMVLELFFAYLGSAAPSQHPQMRYPSRQQVTPQRLDL